MKIGEARSVYSAQINELRNRKNELLKQKKAAEEKGDSEVGQSILLELEALTKEHDKMSSFMENFLSYQNNLYNMEAARQQGDAMADAAQDMVKCIEIARRISNGDKVPSSDEEKLMNFSMEMYMMAKNAAMLNRDKEGKEYDSLWEDEDESENKQTADEIVDDMECSMEPPDISI